MIDFFFDFIWKLSFFVFRIFNTFRIQGLNN